MKPETIQAVKEFYKELDDKYNLIYDKNNKLNERIDEVKDIRKFVENKLHEIAIDILKSQNFLFGVGRVPRKDYYYYLDVEREKLKRKDKRRKYWQAIEFINNNFEIDELELLGMLGKPFIRLVVKLQKIIFKYQKNDNNFNFNNKINLNMEVEVVDSNKVEAVTIENIKLKYDFDVGAGSYYSLDFKLFMISDEFLKICNSMLDKKERFVQGLEIQHQKVMEKVNEMMTPEYMMCLALEG